MFGPITITDDGVALYTEAQIDALHAIRKVRPARGAFGDWNQYDENGNVSVQVIGSTRIVSEDDDLKDDRGYATQTEERLAERGDDAIPDPAASVWYARKGDKIERVWVAKEEPTYSDTIGWNVHGIGDATCWYCEQRYNLRAYAMQSRPERPFGYDAMEGYVIFLMQHTTECRAKHNGTPLIRLVTWAGKGHLYRPNK